MERYVLEQNWSMHVVGSDDWVSATVPGSVYGDLLAAGIIEDPFWKDNEIQATEWMEKDYEYRIAFDCPEEILASDEILLRMEGVDTIADIYLNGCTLGHTENMHRTYEFLVGKQMKNRDNELVVYLHSPNRYIAEAFAKAPTLGTEDAMNGFVHIRKAHYMFGWDWGAHLPDAGIWRPIYLLGIHTARLESVKVEQIHGTDQVALRITPEVAMASSASDRQEQLSYHVTVTSPDAVMLYDGALRDEIVIENPLLWWPNGYGEQPLYTVSVALYQGDVWLDVWERKIGLRIITVDQAKDAWGERFAFCVNGVNIFAMGADYIPEDHLLGRVTPERTKDLLEKAVFAHFNCIRVWGGGYYPDDWFYDLCDALGLIVWQDFMFACAVYDLTPEFEVNIKAEIIDNLKRIRHHASLGLLCGNNEMEQFVREGNWVSKNSEIRDYIIMYEKMIPGIVKEYAPQTFYWPSSPSSGGSFDAPQDENRGDVHYWEVWHGNRPFSDYRKYHFRFLSEFGFQSFPSRKTIETFTDDEHDMNIFSYIMEWHQRNGSANGKIMNYMQQMYRYPTEFDLVLYASQLLQADAIRYGVEHLRRHRNDSRCMGAVYWQFNDCWPVASWSSVDYTGRLKALHYAARRFFAPVMISCEEEGMMGSGQELVRLPFAFPKSIRLCVANESREGKEVLVRWQLRDASAKILREEEEILRVHAMTSTWLDKVELPDVDIYREYVSYQALIDGEVVSEGTVIFSYPKYFQYQDPRLQVEVSGNQITVSADAYAKSVEIRNAEDDLILSDNFFDLNGDSRTVEVLHGALDNIRLRSVYDL